MRITVELSKRDLQIIAAYVGLVNPPDRVQAGDYVRAALRSCLDQDECYLKAKTERDRIRYRIAKGSQRP